MAVAESDPFAAPSNDPADELSLTGAFRAILTKFLQDVDDCLPATVVAYDRVKNRATVKPLIMMGTTDGEKVGRAAIPSVPVFNIGGGGFILSFPIKPGDLGWLKASDRDISLFLQGLKEEWPNTRRAHSFQDALFFPDVMRQWALSGEDADRAVFQSVDGTVRIAIGSDRIKMTAPLIELDTPLVHMTGDLTVAGDVAATGHVSGAGIVLDTHEHHTTTDPSGPPIP